MSDKLYPDVTVVGFPKCGSTSFVRWLSQSDSVNIPSRKEPNYLINSEFHPELAKILRNATTELEYECALSSSECGLSIDGSVNYCWSSEARDRLFALNPKTKIVFIVRNPIDRLISHYLADVSNGRQCLSFRDAVLSSQKREGRNFDDWKPYIYCSNFRTAIEMWLEKFPLDNIYVLNFEDLLLEPHSAAQDLLTDLSVSCDTLPSNMSFENVGSVARNSIVKTLFSERSGQLWGIYKYYGLLPEAVRRSVRTVCFRRRSSNDLSIEMEDRIWVDSFIESSGDWLNSKFDLNCSWR
ncbi:sulfotransferase domain-containing protein [Roseibacillus ishigakijimensis]|uniref:Sulfotransferase domain-containing protein n=1 Tax=Roseibacillus ishigakijimensis TaxID=454146 RepID=A0A934VH75_9BACT|nr:sulfotransferase domain-containing protein [Roseibacillus ishigakijimensis]MBK1833643.1 sulfotransferase domain-containing protein [Roseibacillus ishigakijimensis]